MVSTRTKLSAGPLPPAQEKQAVSIRRRWTKWGNSWYNACSIFCNALAETPGHNRKFAHFVGSEVGFPRERQNVTLMGGSDKPHSSMCLFTTKNDLVDKACAITLKLVNTVGAFTVTSTFSQLAFSRDLDSSQLES